MTDTQAIKRVVEEMERHAATGCRTLPLGLVMWAVRIEAAIQSDAQPAEAGVLHQIYDDAMSERIWLGPMTQRELPAEVSDASSINIEDEIERLYWEFDAMHKGYAKWKQAPRTERDAFKSTMRVLHDLVARTLLDAARLHTGDDKDAESIALEIEVSARAIPLGQAFDGGGLHDAPKYDVMMWAVREIRRRLRRLQSKNEVGK